MRYNFDWDPSKAQQNIRKHTVSFERAATVFRDPNQISIYDEAHSDDEDRWITLGLSQEGNLLVVVHTFLQTSESSVSIRIISARKATRAEVRNYEEYGI